MAAMDDARDKFTNLPLEMLQGIAAHLDLHNRLKLRTVFKKEQEDVVVDLLGGALKTLYVSLTEVSISHFESITSSKFFAKHIDTIVYLPYVLSYVVRDDSIVYQEDVERHFDEYWTGEHGQSDFNLSEARRSYAIYRDIYQQHRAYSSYRDPDIDDLLKVTLQAGLKRLRNLHSMVVLPVIRAEGLNASSVMYEEKFASRQSAKVQGNLLSQDKFNRAAVATVRDHFSYNFSYRRMVPYTDVIFRAMEEATVQLRVLSIGDFEDEQFMDTDLNYFGQVAMRSSGDRDALRHVEDLTVGVYDTEDGDGPGPRARNWKTIAHSVKMLQRLTMLVHEHRYVRDKDPDYAASRRLVDYFLEIRSYEHLRSLHLQGESQCLGFVDSRTLEDFVHHHSTSGVLCEVRLSDIVTVEFYGSSRLYGDRTAPKTLLIDGMRSFLEQVPEFTLDVFEMKVEYRNHETRPNYSSGDLLDQVPQVTWFEELASELDVRLSDDGWKDGVKGWDFGQAEICLIDDCEESE